MTVALQVRELPLASPKRVLACGAWLKNTACLIEGNKVFWSPVHGDLGTTESRHALMQSVQALRDAVSGPVEAVAHDLHPDFFSTELAIEVAAELEVPAVAVQHHHAHMGVVQAEHGFHGAMAGLALDGVGLGTDNTAWGGEVLRVEGVRWQRVEHLPELLMPGGDVAAREPWRMAASLMHKLGHGGEIAKRFKGIQGVSDLAVDNIHKVLQRGINCPPTSSAGRWFDAVAAMLNICVVQKEEAEAAMALERLAASWLCENPGFVSASQDHQNLQSCMDAVTRKLMLPQTSGAESAAHFHLELANALAQSAWRVVQKESRPVVALGGGCFFNAILRKHVSEQLKALGAQVLTPVQSGFGDAGLALGQAWIAAHTNRRDVCV